MVVERQLGEQGMTRHDLGREKFIDKVWEWKDQSGGQIFEQLQRLGATCDWDRERFTMDEGLSKAVRKVFVQLYKEGLIYRDKRLVNWDPKFHTAISDLEVEQKEVNGHMWHFRYPVEGEEGRFITVATTRPETMLGDTGIAVHPEDDRYKDLVGKFAILPIVGRRIPIVADDYADPEQGSGAVKITPAHDFNDFEVGKRAGLDVINIMDENAHLNDTVPEAYRGMERFEARKKVVAEMENLGLLEKIDDHPHTVPYGDRSGVIIEPLLTDQWFADAATLAQPAIRAVESGKTKFVPEKWTNTYYDWMRNIQPWCISRQLWWGHRIPAWFGPDGMIFVEETEEAAFAAAEAHYGKKEEITRDTDVLDTWFSSALWPFSTLGWPDKTPELARYYPTDVLVTGFDIIFFWVARMMMMSLEFMGQVPFKDVYIHALVLDEKGQKMSKSKGNVMDPLELVDEYGADALRFTMGRMAGQGRNIRLSKQAVEGNRNFSTKLWNAARFAEMNECGAPGEIDFNEIQSPVNRWILGELTQCVADVGKGIEDYRFDDGAGAIYRFVWNTFCDWYLELIKPLLGGMDDAAKSETRMVCGYVLDETLKLLHPFMPFVTEELWDRRAPGRVADQGFLMGQQWPAFTGFHDDAAAEEVDWVIGLITELRSLRNDLGVPAGAKIPLALVKAGAEIEDRAMRHEDVLKRLARLEDIAFTDATPEGAVTAVFGETVAALQIADFVDIAEARKRLDKELGQIEKDITSTEKKLSNENFVARAPEEIVEENRQRLVDWAARREKLTAARKGLEGL
jgi:valyl-tRNA synthetase